MYKQCSNPWPRWPQYSSQTLAQLKSVLDSGRWAISGPSSGSHPKEQEFAKKFASWNNVPYCVPTDHGSSSLVIALEALDIGSGDEVIVPALTWVATATAVLSVNAAPVFVDVDRDTCCISPAAIEQAITPRTKAIIPVHLHCVMADMDRIMEIAEIYHLRVIEDCAQSHGASWRGRRAGSIGDLGAFSVQQSKVLCAGEGGAVITKSKYLYERLQQLRADARAYSPETPVAGEMHLVEVGGVMGTNFCLSEFQAAILLDQLERLDEQNAIREENARYLNDRLQSLSGLKPLKLHCQMDKQSVYEYAVRYSPEEFAGKSVAQVCRELQSVLGFPVYQTDKPLHQNTLYCPWTKRRFSAINHPHASTQVRDLHFPEAEAAREELILFHHSVLLGTRFQMELIVEAFGRVLKNDSH